ncbi:MAG: hypothetical protein H0U48_03070 [Euzebyaceae bacterium]|jgi:hypothetical protein|nr:hypothetical protein [Euzebyaceae bacterium]
MQQTEATSPFVLAGVQAEAVELVRSSGKTVPEISHDLDLTETSARAWVRRGDIDAVTAPG